jgi:hypothetical protein
MQPDPKLFAHVAFCCSIGAESPNQRKRMERMERKAGVLAMRLLTTVLCFLTAGNWTYANEPELLPVVCSAETLTVATGKTVRLRVWVDPSQSQDLYYEWSVPVGMLEGTGQEVTWKLIDVKPGAYEAHIRIRDKTGWVSECATQVIVRDAIQVRDPNRQTGRALLLPDQLESEGYGLYSYLLFGSRPSDANRERYLKAIEEYLKFPDVARLEKYIMRMDRVTRQEARRRLNITYLPLRNSPAADIRSKWAAGDYGLVAQWMLTHYDYARARVLLSKLSGEHLSGPYIVSVLKPPRGIGAVRPLLFQDQSAVPAHIVPLWMREFLHQAAQERFWQTKTARQLALKLRTIVAVLARALPVTQKALRDRIVWLDEVKG